MRGESTSTAPTALSTRPRVRALDLVGEPQHRNRQRDVGLDRGDDVGRRRVPRLEQPHHPIARLDENRERLERLERGGQTPAMPFVVVPLAGGVRVSWVSFCSSQ